MASTCLVTSYNTEEYMPSSEYRNIIVGENREKIEIHIREILKLIGEDVDREGLQDTPARVTRMYEEIFGGYRVDSNEVLGTIFDELHEELVIVKDIEYYSQCEHHMIPFFGKVHIGYIPNGKIVGLSKLARLVDVVTRRLQLQERITSEISDIIMNTLNPEGVMVVVTGKHLCMCARGVKKSQTETITTASSGVFRTNSILRNEFYCMIN